MVLYNGMRLLAPDDRLLGSGYLLGDVCDERWARGRVVAIVENPADALLMESNTSSLAIATLGVSIWKPEWTALLKASQPKRVIVCYDNDAAGNGVRDDILQTWRDLHKKNDLPPQRGLALTKELKQAGLPVEMYDWGQSPAGTDIGDVLRKFVQTRKESA